MHGDTTRLFFALKPPPEVAAEIAARRDALALHGRPVAQRRLHLTLLFLGNVDAAGRAAWMHRAQSLCAPRFVLSLDRLGYFARPAIAWLGMSRVPGALRVLHDELNKNTVDGIDSPRFRPHVSLVRNAPPIKPGPIAPIEWTVTDFSLIASGDGGVPGAYRELGRWPLAEASVDGRAL